MRTKEKVSGHALSHEKSSFAIAEAPPAVPVIMSAAWSPSLGMTAKMYSTTSAEVIGWGTAMEIYSDPLVRGTDAKVRLKVNNLEPHDGVYTLHKERQCRSWAPNA